MNVARECHKAVGHNELFCAFPQEEFVGATRLCRDMKKADRSRANWQRLFEPYDFFKGFKNYLQVCYCFT